jgi:HK97 family phage major capsid protein
MNLAELRKKLAEVVGWLTAYRDLKPEERTAEKRTEKDAKLLEVKQIEGDIRDLEEIEAAEKRAMATTNGNADNLPGGPGVTVTVEDQPIYRSKFPLGEQMRDIATICKREGGDREAQARSRHEQVVKREQTLAEKRAAGTGGMVKAVGEDGGLLLQGETAIELITNGFNNSAVLSRTAQRDIGMNQFVDLVGIDETSRADGSRGGGVRVYTDAELALMTQSKTKFAKIRIEPKRLTGMYFASDEILNNAPLLQGEMSELFNLEFAFKAQDLVINGNGAGQALGVLNAPALVTVSKETGQTAKTIVFQNLVKMKSRLMLRNRRNLLWIANQDIEPQLFTLSLPVGTGGSVMPVYLPAMNQDSEVAGTLMGIPIVFVEQCATLGTVGDIVLADWSTYWAANKGGVESASSIHLKFDYNQTTFRFVTWFDGQPRLQNAILPYKANSNSDRVSSFVALATRA